ncbi:hypothetical protein ACVJGD_007825 [Bradyrhizobium sp. USDA 10063]
MISFSGKPALLQRRPDTKKVLHFVRVPGGNSSFSEPLFAERFPEVLGICLRLPVRDPIQ